MLKKKERLTKKEFDRSFSVGKRFHSPVLQLIYAPGADFHGAAVVGKKVYKKAVDRNSLRRRLYAVLYRYGKQQGKKGTFMLIAKPSITALSRKDVVAQAQELLGRV